MKKRYEYTPDPMTDLMTNEVFVFGANQLGEHNGGSAYAAKKFYGAVQGEIHRTGRCYGLVTINFPTGTTDKILGREPNRITFEELSEEFKDFFKAAELESEKIFYLTKVGLGIAGWSLEEVKAAFNLSYMPGRHKNVVIPIDFS
ncbi:MAG: hypothetical protein ABIP51_01730 [Bacteroidia bacterium]